MGPPGGSADLTIALSLATDVGTGQPLEHGAADVLAVARRVEALDFNPEMLSCLYSVRLLRFGGCSSDASAPAVLAGGDETAFNATMITDRDGRSGEAMREVVRHLAKDQPLPRRMGRIIWALLDRAMDQGSLRAIARRPPGSASATPWVGIDRVS